MGDKGHFWISIFKSIVRIVGFCMTLYSLKIGVGVLVFAELLGVLEEFADKRGTETQGSPWAQMVNRHLRRK